MPVADHLVHIYTYSCIELGEQWLQTDLTSAATFTDSPVTSYPILAFHMDRRYKTYGQTFVLDLN